MKKKIMGTGAGRLPGTACAVAALVIGVAGAMHPAMSQAAAPETPQIELAQTIDATPKSFSIPGGPLPDVLAAFGEQSGLQVLYPSDVARDAVSKGVEGTMTPDAALIKILGGTGLTYRATSNGTVTVETVSENTTVLSPIMVETQGESAFGPAPGFVATRSASGTKTDTPLIETPQSVSVITADELKSRNVNKYSDALRYTPGVEPELYGLEPRYTNISFRGLLSTTTGFFQDGMALTNPGYIVSYNPEPWGAERIEVPRGPSSVLYGQGSAGGLVNYVSKRPTMDPIRVVSLETGNHDRFQGKFDLGGAVNEDKGVAFRIAGLVRNADTQIDYLQDDRVWVAPSLSIQPREDTKVTFFAMHQKDETKDSQALPGIGTLSENPNGPIDHSTFVGEPDIDQYVRTEYAAGVEVEHSFDAATLLRHKTRFHKIDLNDDVVYGSGFDGNRTLSRSYYSSHGNVNSLTSDTNLEVEKDLAGAKHTFLGGLDIQAAMMRTDQKSGSVTSIDIYNPTYGANITGLAQAVRKDFITNQTGIYLQDQIEVGDHWRFTLGGRYDWALTDTDNKMTGAQSRQTDSDFTGRAGVVYLFDNGLAPYASYSESFLPVTDNTNANGDFFEPETGQQYEVGIKYQPKGQQSFITVSAFDLKRQNYTEYDAGTTSYVQTGEVQSRGIEVEGLASFDFGLDVKAGYTLLQTEILKSTKSNEVGKQLSQVPQQTATIWGDYTFQNGPLKGFGLGAGARYRSSHFGDNANTLTIPGRVLFDAGAHYQLEQLRFAVNAQNITDKQHVGSCYYRGSSVLCTTGEGLTVTANMTYEW